MANCSMCGRRIGGFSFGKRLCQWCVRHQAAQRGELPDDAPLPVMVAPWEQSAGGNLNLSRVLVFVNVVIFIAMGISGVSLSDPSSQDLIRWGANYGPRTMSGEWWRLLTYNFLHGGFIHIAFNMWCLWDIGALCESLYGTWTFGALYMITGVAGGLASIGWSPGRLSVGASGAIFGIAGALIAGYKFGEFALPRVVVQAQLRSLLIFAGYNILFGAVSRGTDNSAHLGGVVAGLICGTLIAKLAPAAENVGMRFAILLLAAAALGGTIMGMERSRGYLIHAQRGSMLLMQAKYDDAIQELQTALRQRPSYSDARLDLAEAFYNKGQYDRARAEIMQVLAADPQNPEAQYYSGFIYIKERRPAEAQNIFSKLIQAEPSMAGARYGLGVSLAAQGNDHAAIEEYKRAIEARPDFEGAYFNLGLSQMRLKLYNDAIATFQKGQRMGDSYDTEMALAQAYDGKGMKNEADAARRKAEELKGK